MIFKKAEAEMAKILKIWLCKYKWNGPPQSQTVEFRDLVGVGIAPASKKSAIAYYI